MRETKKKYIKRRDGEKERESKRKCERRRLRKQRVNGAQVRALRQRAAEPLHEPGLEKLVACLCGLSIKQEDKVALGVACKVVMPWQVCVEDDLLHRLGRERGRDTVRGHVQVRGRPPYSACPHVSPTSLLLFLFLFVVYFLCPISSSPVCSLCLLRGGVGGCQPCASLPVSCFPTHTQLFISRFPSRFTRCEQRHEALTAFSPLNVPFRRHQGRYQCQCQSS